MASRQRTNDFGEKLERMNERGDGREEKGKRKRGKRRR